MIAAPVLGPDCGPVQVRAVPHGWRSVVSVALLVARYYEARTADDLAGIRAEIEGWLAGRGVAVDGLGTVKHMRNPHRFADEPHSLQSMIT